MEVPTLFFRVFTPFNIILQSLSEAVAEKECGTAKAPQLIVERGGEVLEEYGFCTGPAAELLARFFDEKGDFCFANFEEWVWLAGKLTQLWFPEHPNPVQQRVKSSPVKKLSRPASGFVATPGFVVTPAGPNEVQEWKEEAAAGKATSASPPAVVTPEIDRTGFFDVASPTSPQKVPNPMRKSVLVADRKLQAELKKHGIKLPDKPANGAKSGEGAVAATAAPKGLSGDGAAAPMSSAAPKDPSGDRVASPKPCAPDPSAKDPAEGPPKRKRNNGPMQAVMREFINLKRAEGLSYHEAMGLWRGSAERQAIVDKIPEGERKKRRY